jgi:protein-L-isoaspartate(D-aspartate) O-methyltransferase
VTSYEKFQKQLLAVANSKFRDDEKLSDSVVRAFGEVPRHLFVSRYRNYGMADWFEISDENLEQHLSTLYADNPLVLFGSDADFESKKGTRNVSTISQPSFVLRMIDILNVQPGDNVFELGAASGWNAALMSRLVGSKGKVVTVEIIPELACSADERLRRLGYENVIVVKGDAGDGCADYAPFDRVMFTAGAFDLPKALHSQVKEGGQLLFVLKNKGGADNLIRLKKAGDHFESTYSMPCGFVPMTGKYHLPEMEEEKLDEIFKRTGISEKPTMNRNFWWGVGSPKQYLWGTSALRSFLSLWNDNFCAIDTGKRDEDAFGWLEGKSFALAKPGSLASFGGNSAAENLLEKIKYWIDIGMPTLSNLNLKVYPSGVEVSEKNGSWISRRRESTFVWSLPN